MTPKLKMSDDGFAARAPFASSGAMYFGVPMSTPVSVSGPLRLDIDPLERGDGRNEVNDDRNGGGNDDVGEDESATRDDDGAGSDGAARASGIAPTVRTSFAS